MEAQLDAWIEDIHEEDVVVMLTDIFMGKRQPEDHAEAAEPNERAYCHGTEPALASGDDHDGAPVGYPGTHIRKVKSCRDSIAFMREVTVEFQDGDE